MNRITTKTKWLCIVGISLVLSIPGSIYLTRLEREANPHYLEAGCVAEGRKSRQILTTN